MQRSGELLVLPHSDRKTSFGAVQTKSFILQPLIVSTMHTTTGLGTVTTGLGSLEERASWLNIERLAIGDYARL
jgi:hypothetical protein